MGLYFSQYNLIAKCSNEIDLISMHLMLGMSGFSHLSSDEELYDS